MSTQSKQAQHPQQTEQSAHLFVTECDNLSGFYAARAALTSRKWKQVCCGVTDKNTEYAQTLQREGGHLIEYDWSNPKQIAHAITQCEALYLVAPKDFDGVEKVDAVLAQMGQMELPMHRGQAQGGGSQGGQHGKLKAAVVESCITAALTEERGEDHKNVVKFFHELEKSVHKHCRGACIARYGFLMQGLFCISDILQDRGIIALNMGQGQVAPVNLKDACTAGNQVLFEMWCEKQEAQHHGQVYTFTGARLVNGTQLAETASTALDARVTYEPVSDDEMRNILHKSELARFVVEHFVMMGQLICKNKLAMRTGDLEKVLQRQPTTIDRFFSENKTMFKPRRGHRVAKAAISDF